MCLMIGWLSSTAQAGRPEAEISRAVSKCSQALAGVAKIDPAARAATIAIGCSDLYIEARCRQAWTNFEVPPSQRLVFIVGECRATYCPLLTPKPALCSAELGKLDFGERTRLWGLLQSAIFERDLGPAAKRLVAPVTEALSVLPSSTKPVSAEAEPDLVLRVGLKTLTLSRRADGDKPLVTLRVPAKKAQFELAALQTALAEMVSRRWPDPSLRPEASKGLTLVVDRDVPYSVVVAILDAVRSTFPNVTFGLAP